MDKCKRTTCERSFVKTSWTRDRFWINFCPKCIVEFLEESIQKTNRARKAEFGRG